jgi:hypothetical protein
MKRGKKSRLNESSYEIIVIEVHFNIVSKKKVHFTNSISCIKKKFKTKHESKN